MMDEYTIVWRNRFEGKYTVCAVGYRRAVYAVIKTGIKLAVGSVVYRSGGTFYFKKKAAGKAVFVRHGLGVGIDLSYDIKYIGGYSKDGRVVFLDRRFPKSHIFSSKKISLIESVARRHEVVEKWMIDDGFSYEHSHRVATGVERRYVESRGVAWKEYDQWCRKEIRKITSMPLSRSPRSLDLTPYHDNIEALSEIKRTFV